MRIRKMGMRPSDVFVQVLQEPPATKGLFDAELAISFGFFPQIDVAPNDQPLTLDLRCLRGVRVHVCGEDQQRVLAVANRAVAFNPAEIIAAGYPGELFLWKPNA